jgi:hypothetical protein
MSLTLIEAIAGHERAASVARDLGVDNWDARHDSSAFRLNRGFVMTIAGNSVAFWGHQTLGLKIEPGVDEVALALTADAWSRTYRSTASIYAANADVVRTRGGIGIMPDHVGDAKKHTLPPLPSTFPAKALDSALNGIAARYGRQTWTLVATQLEYPATAPAMPQK